jgi:hypothetical protein
VCISFSMLCAASDFLEKFGEIEEYLILIFNYNVSHLRPSIGDTRHISYYSLTVRAVAIATIANSFANMPLPFPKITNLVKFFNTYYLV